MVSILIRYLGIKTKLLEPIKHAIKEITPKNDGVLDLFAGSCSVSEALMDTYPVYTNDYQEYSYIAAKALVEYHSKETVESLSASEVFGEHYKKNISELSSRFSTPLAFEDNILNKIGDLYYGETFDLFTRYFDNSAYAGHIENVHESFTDCLSYYSHDEIEKYRKNPKLFPYALFTLYYGNPYFSLHQCIEIDSIKYSIDTLLHNGDISEEKYNLYLSFLIYSLNLIVISVGDHFAQPQKIKEVRKDLSGARDSINLRERKKIIGKKRTKVTLLFSEKLIDFKNNYHAGAKENKAFNYNYKDLLSSKILDNFNIRTLYIDPPYTNAHYSRFYHIPETLVKYDYPKIKFAGRYRTDRFQSGFCIKSQAIHEFSTLLSLSREKNYNLVISYSDTAQCMITIKELTELCKKYYSDGVKIENIAHMYRNFGQKPNRVLAKEYIITCSINRSIKETLNEKIHGE